VGDYHYKAEATFFLIQKNHLYKRKHIETPGTPELARNCRQFTGEK
jgi:hypothetical protein